MRGAVPLLRPLYLHGVDKDTLTLTTSTIPTKSSDSPQLRVSNKVEGVFFASSLNPGGVTVHVSQRTCVFYKWERWLKMGASGECSTDSLFPNLSVRQQ
jgi:hypothetical protein